MIHCTCGHLLVESESSQIFSNQWRLDALSIPHYVIKKVRPHGVRHGKTEGQKEHFVAHNARKRCIKKILKEFTIVFNEIQYIVIRNSKLAGLRRSASQWINWHRKTTPTAYPMRNMREINILVSHTERIGQKCTDETRSDFRTAVTFMNRLHRESGEERPEPIPFQQYPRWHPSSSSSSSWWQWVKNVGAQNLSCFLNCVVAGSSTADGNLLQPTGV